MYRSRIVLSAATLAVALIFGAAFADEGHQHGKASKAKKGDPIIVCPVTGEKAVKSKAIPVIYKNKKYYLCCKMCVAPFKKNPAKYIKKAAKYADPVKSTIYSCPMHPEVVAKKPGICPKCKMKLEPKADQKKAQANSSESEHTHSQHSGH